MRAISPDMRKTAPHCQVPGRPHVLNTVEDERNTSIMTHPAFRTTLSADELDVIQTTAEVWRSRGYGKTADNLLAIAGLAAPAERPQQVLIPSPRLASVTDLSTYRLHRHGGAA